jgi:hypothetical protein
MSMVPPTKAWRTYVLRGQTYEDPLSEQLGEPATDA